jgi:hypothetical protein
MRIVRRAEARRSRRRCEEGGVWVAGWLSGEVVVKGEWRRREGLTRVAAQGIVRVCGG